MCGDHSQNCIRTKYTTQKTAAAQKEPDVEFSAERQKKALETKYRT